jgi:hypothetical protein
MIWDDERFAVAAAAALVFVRRPSDAASSPARQK